MNRIAFPPPTVPVMPNPPLSDTGLHSVVHNLNSMLATMSTALRLLRTVRDADTRGQLLDVIDDATTRAEQTVAKIRTRRVN
jgi:hypothetical protein